MKRTVSCILCMALLASLCLCLAGCASSGESVPGAPAETVATVSPSPSLTPTAAPVPAISPEPLVMGSYSCADFIITIPEGWEVSYEVFDAGGGISRIVINVTDPQDPNNMLFYTSAIEPFFLSPDAKNAYLPSLATYYEWSPVLSASPSAEATLGQWAAMFTLMQAEGLGLDKYFKNYLVKQTLATVTADGSADEYTRSGVLAAVSIPAADSRYAMYFENSLILQPVPAGLPEDAKYYISCDNYGIVVREDQYEVWFPQLAECLKSLNLSAFAGQHDIAGSSGRLSVKIPTDIPLG